MYRQRRRSIIRTERYQKELDDRARSDGTRGPAGNSHLWAVRTHDCMANKVSFLTIELEVPQLIPNKWRRGLRNNTYKWKQWQASGRKSSLVKIKKNLVTLLVKKNQFDRDVQSFRVSGGRRIKYRRDPKIISGLCDYVKTLAEK